MRGPPGTQGSKGAKGDKVCKMILYCHLFSVCFAYQLSSSVHRLTTNEGVNTKVIGRDCLLRQGYYQLSLESISCQLNCSTRINHIQLHGNTLDAQLNIAFYIGLVLSGQKIRRHLSTVLRRKSFKKKKSLRTMAWCSKQGQMKDERR